MYILSGWTTERVTRMFSTIRKRISISFYFGFRSRIYLSFIRESRYSIKTYVRGSKGNNRTLK